MSAELLRRAAERLRDPLLCNWPEGVPVALADLLDAVCDELEQDGGVIRTSRQRLAAVATARAILREPEATS